MTKVYNNPYYPLPIKWIRVNDCPEGWFTNSWGTEDKVWYPMKIPVFKPMAEVKAEQEYYAKLEHQYWEEERRKCLEDPQYYFAKYIKFIKR